MIVPILPLLLNSKKPEDASKERVDEKTREAIRNDAKNLTEEQFEKKYGK